MKFLQRLEINELHFKNFDAIIHATLVLGPQKSPQKFSIKSGLIPKRLQLSKNYFMWLYVGVLEAPRLLSILLTYFLVLQFDQYIMNTKFQNFSSILTSPPDHF